MKKNVDVVMFFLFAMLKEGDASLGFFNLNR
jgi:hypothetical protein